MAFRKLDFLITLHRHIRIYLTNFGEVNSGQCWQLLRFSKIYTACLLFLSFFSYRGYTQSPAYEIIGAQILEGVHIFDMLVAKNEVIYIATDHGLYHYRNDEIRPIAPAEGQKGNAFFQLRETASGRIICNNLLGQWLEVRGNTSTILFELPLAKASSLPKVAVKEEVIWIMGNQLFKYDLASQYLQTVRSFAYQHFILNLVTTEGGQILGIGDDQLIEIKNDTLLSRQIPPLQMEEMLANGAIWHPLRRAGKGYFLNEDGILYHKQRHIRLAHQGALLELGDHNLWLRDPLQGIHYYTWSK
ncbi:MAG: hypothetical protein AAGJ18_24545, partial [Bacteroidota bacterium]